MNDSILQCIYCGTDTIPSARWEHWRFCPKCEPHMILGEQPPRPTREELLLDKGRPTRNGKKA